MLVKSTPRLIPEYTSGTPLAKPSDLDGRRDIQVRCLICGTEGDPDAFIDRRDYMFAADDTYDCPGCGMNTVVTLRSPAQSSEPCPICSGTGAFRVSYRSVGVIDLPCPRCWGRGEVMNEVQYAG